jgi:hypothetical protein
MSSALSSPSRLTKPVLVVTANDDTWQYVTKSKESTERDFEVPVSRIPTGAEPHVLELEQLRWRHPPLRRPYFSEAETEEDRCDPLPECTRKNVRAHPMSA